MNDNIPQTIAIIMDGNGRWAKQRGLPRTAGHKQGADTIRTVALAANELGVKKLILYAFSTENWKRPEDEVGYLCKLPGVGPRTAGACHQPGEAAGAGVAVVGHAHGGHQYGRGNGGH